MIHCTLFDVSLSTSPRYEALSYTWAIDGQFSGPRADASRRTVICNGAAIDVFQNLYNALAQLQQLGWTSIPLWIDAICINQHDEPEKSAQVNMMGDIFRTASRVVVWLGRSSMATELALDKVEKIDFQAITEAGPYRTALLVGTMLGALTWVLSRGWFERVWTLQEAALARDIVYLIGRRLIPLDQLLHDHYAHLCADDSIGAFRRVNMRTSGLIFARSARKLLFDDGIGVCTLEAALKETRNRRSADGRDKLFGVLALCGRRGLGDAAHLIADYEKSIQEVYCEAAAALLQSKSTGLFLLSLVGQIRDDTFFDYAFNSSYIKLFKPDEGFVEDLPSWVPDLSAPTRPVPLRDIQATLPYSAASSISPNFSIGGYSGRLLRLKASILDTITMTGDCLPARTQISNPIWRLFRLPLKLPGFPVEVYAPTNESILRAFWRTLVAGIPCRWDEIELTDALFIDWFVRSPEDTYDIPAKDMFRLILQDCEGDGELDLANEPDDRHHIGQWEHVAHSKPFKKLDRYKVNAIRNFMVALDSPLFGIRMAMEQRRKQLKGMNVAQVVAESGNLLPFGSAFEEIYLDRRMFITEKGYMGTGPWTVLDGDVVMLVAGAYVPYVFRRSTRVEGSWELVGEAYCHGFMFGEGLEMESLEFNEIEVV